jgi:hypothetical protein
LQMSLLLVSDYSFIVSTTRKRALPLSMWS